MFAFKEAQTNVVLDLPKLSFQVDAAMAARPHIIDGKTVDPKRAVPRDQSTRSEANVSSKRLYVSGVREEHTEQMFENYFNRFGKVLKVSSNCSVLLMFLF